MPEIDKAAALKTIAKWVGPPLIRTFEGEGRVAYIWSKFADVVLRGCVLDLDDMRHVFALQAEIERRGLLGAFCRHLFRLSDEAQKNDDDTPFEWLYANATADTRTRAVLAVIEQEAANG